MKRSLIQLGNKSYSITIPKEWVRNNRLIPKAELEITNQGKSLLIGAENAQEMPEKDILVKHSEIYTISKKIASLYREGYKELRIRFQCPNHARINNIQKYAMNFHGVDVRLNDNTLIISENFDCSECDRILKRTFQSLIAMCEILENPSKDDLWQKDLRKAHTNSLFLIEFAFRTLNKEGYADAKELSNQLSKAWSLRVISELMYNIPKCITKGSYIQIKGLKKMISSTYDACYCQREKDYIRMPLHMLKSNSSLAENLNIICMLCRFLVQSRYVL